jgi:hypothetical protein
VLHCWGGRLGRDAVLGCIGVQRALSAAVLDLAGVLDGMPLTMALIEEVKGHDCSCASAS